MKKILTIPVILILLFSAGIVRSTENYFLYFDGINDYLVIPHSESLFVGTDDFLIEATFKITGEPQINRFFYFTNKMSGEWENYLDFFWQEFGSPLPEQRKKENLGDLWDGTNWTQIKTDIEIEQSIRDIWHTTKLEREGTILRIYLNNILHEETDFSIIANINNLSGIFVGVDNTFEYWGNGYLDDLKISINSVLVGSWDFNEGSGVVAYDTSGYDNHGSITGAEFVPETPEVEANFFNFTGEMTGSILSLTGNLFSSIAPALVFVLGLPLALNYILPKLIELMTKNPK